MRAARVTMVALISVAVLVLGLVLGSVPALAVVGHVTLPFSPLGSFVKATGIAVDQSSGNIFVADTGSDKVLVFSANGGSPAGGIPAVLSGERTPAGSFSFGIGNKWTGIAVDNSCFQHKISGGACSSFDASDQDIYVTDLENHVVDKFRVNGSNEYEYVSQLTGFGLPDGVTIDREGDVYVSDYASGTIDEFNSKGESIRVIAGPLGRPPGDIAVDATGDIYAQTAEAEPGFSRLKRSSFVGEVESEEVRNSGEEPFPTGLVFDQATGNLFVALDSRAPSFSVTEYNGAGEVQSTFDPEEFYEGGQKHRGVAVNESTGDVYVVGGGSETVNAFGPVATLASAVTGGMSSIGRTSATVEGTVNPESETLEASCEVQYGTSTAYGQTAPCAPEKVGTGEEPVPVTAALVGLEAGTLYYYRVVAVNTNGADPAPQDGTFTTTLAVEGVLTGEPMEVGKTSVTLSGALKPNGVDAHYYFEYGESEEYGSLIPVPPGTDAGVGNLVIEEVVPATVDLVGLRANTTYYYRLVASNEFGVTPASEGKSFRTLPVDPRVLSQSATLIFPREALLGAVVVPEESNTTYHFAYGPTAAYGSIAPVGDVELGTGTEGLQALLTVSGLQPDTTYHYAVVATNVGGSTFGPDETFTTSAAALPVVVTGGAGEVSQNAAVVSGSVDAEGVPASYEWDLGTDTTYGTRVSGEAGSGMEPQTVTLGLQGLAAGTTYHYRLVARNTYGTVYGADEAFTTPGFPSALLVSPAGAPLVPAPMFTEPSLKGIVGSTGTPGGKAKHRARRKSKARRKARKASANAKRASARGERGRGR
jgi:hypothetical protein